MKLFACQFCGNLLYFENTTCEACHRRLGYLPDRETLTALEPDGEAFVTLAEPTASVRFCANAEHLACNWLVDVDGPPLCLACRHNQTIPDVSVSENLLRWRNIEVAKHRLFYALLKLRLPTPVAGEDNEPLLFDFLADIPNAKAKKVMTGHENGLITLALKEGDEAERTALREKMHEPYRTLLGHFRHEVGHYYWDKLVRDGGWLDACRAVFGDDSASYEYALARHYRDGAPADWQENFISAYATMHPWEDFAETWAHYLHIVDTLETASAFGMKVAPTLAEGDPEMMSEIAFDPYRAPDAQRLIGDWLPLTYAVNSLNRSMGNGDLYPFVVSPAVVAKLQFIHEVVQRVADGVMSEAA